MGTYNGGKFAADSIIHKRMITGFAFDDGLLLSVSMLISIPEGKMLSRSGLVGFAK